MGENGAKSNGTLQESLRLEVAEYVRDMLCGADAVANLAGMECGRWGALCDRLEDKNGVLFILASDELTRWTAISDQAESDLEKYEHVRAHIRGDDWESDCVHAIADEMITSRIIEMAGDLMRDSADAMRAERPDDQDG